jgi:hypothetical protein
LFWGTGALIIDVKGKTKRIYTIDSLGNPEMATFKSDKLSLFDG